MSKTTIHSLEVTFTCMAEWTREEDGETRECGTQIRSPKSPEGDGDSFTVECERCGTVYEVSAKAGAKKGKRETSGDAPAHDSYGRPVNRDGTPFDRGEDYDKRDAGDVAVGEDDPDEEDDEPHVDDSEETAAEKRARKARNKKRREAAAAKREEEAVPAGAFGFQEDADPNA